MKHKFRKIGMVLIFVPLVLFLFSLAVMYLWNLVLPGVIHVSRINLWQALGILVLSKILFGGFRHGWGNRGGNWKRREFKERFQEGWRKKMEDKLANMSPEEKEKFKQDWRNRCSRWGRPAAFDTENKAASPSTPE